MYIIKHDFNNLPLQTLPYYYYVRVIDTETFEEIYNPNFATLFNTKEDALKFINTYSTLPQYSEVVKSEDAIDAYDKWVKSGAVRRTFKCINTTKSRPYNGESLDELIDWWVYVRLNRNQIKTEHHVTWPELYKKSKHLFEVMVYHNRVRSERYITFEIYTSQNGKFEEFNEELNLVMDKVTYKDDDGYLIFPIFDHYLSEGGNTVCLLIHPETKQVEIGSPTFSSQREEFPSLEDAFNYMKEERYYDKLRI
jgi:hypothetical protein